VRPPRANKSTLHASRPRLRRERDPGRRRGALAGTGYRQTRAALFPLGHLGLLPPGRRLSRAGAPAPREPRHVCRAPNRGKQVAAPVRAIRGQCSTSTRRRRSQARPGRASIDPAAQRRSRLRWPRGFTDLSPSSFDSPRMGRGREWPENQKRSVPSPCSSPSPNRR
jgi:hypothetical protein